MKIQKLALFAIVTIMAFFLFACSSSEQTSEDQKDKTPPPPPVEKQVETPPQQEQPAQRASDTIDVDVQREQRPPTETTQPIPTKPQTPTAAGGQYTVQIGAYKMLDNAEKIASLAKERFGKNVYTFQDMTTDLYKVTIGEFFTKEEARTFRDTMVQQHPNDYKDAWVSEIPKK